MSYTLTKTDGTTLTTVADQTIVTDVVDVALVGRGAVNYGALHSENFIHLLENFAFTSAPANPMIGQLWYDTDATFLNVWDGAEWKALTMGYGQGTTFSGLMSINLADTTAMVLIAGGIVVAIICRETIAHALLPATITIGNSSYAIAASFPNGINAGITLATNNADFQFKGHVTSADIASVMGGGTPFGAMSYATVGASTVLVMTSNGVIGCVFSQAIVAVGSLPSTLGINGVNYTFQSRFPNGLIAGFTFASDNNTTYGISGLATEGDIASLTGALNNEISARASAVSSLSALITQNANGITSQASQITSLSSSITDAATKATGAATAVSSLTTTVNDYQGQITAISQANTTLTTTVNNNSATVSTFASSINGLQAKYGVTLDVNGYVTGFAQNNNGSTGSFIVRADTFQVVMPGNSSITPFSISGNTVTMSNVVVDTLKVNTAIIPARATATSSVYGSSSNTTVTPSRINTLLTTTIVMPVSGYIEVTGAIKQAFSGSINGNTPWSLAIAVTSSSLPNGGGELPESLTGGTVPGDSVISQGAIFVGPGTYTVSLTWGAYTTISVNNRSLFVKGFPYTA